MKYSKEQLATIAKQHTKEMYHKYESHIRICLKEAEFYGSRARIYHPSRDRDSEIPHVTQYILSKMSVIDTVFEYTREEYLGACVLNLMHTNDFLSGGNSLEAKLCHNSSLYNMFLECDGEDTDYGVLYIPHVVFDNGVDMPSISSVVTCMKQERIIDSEDLLDRLEIGIDVAAMNCARTLIIGVYGNAYNWIKHCDQLLGITPRYIGRAEHWDSFDRVVLCVPEESKDYEVVESYLNCETTNLGKLIAIGR